MLEFGIVNFWVYVLGAFAVIIAPGPNSLFVLKTAVTEGRRPALAGALAVLVGDSVLITCSFVGVAAMLIFQTVVNIGMCLFVMPVIGLTLPFFSYGGTALFVLLCEIGVLLSIS